MKHIIIPSNQVKSFTINVDKFNMIHPIETKDGRYCLPIEVFNIRSLKPNGISYSIFTKLNMFPVVDLTKKDFPAPSAISNV